RWRQWRRWRRRGVFHERSVNFMFGMGLGELLVVFAIALTFLGPEKIPSTARTLGRWFHEIKNSLDEVKNSFERDFTESSNIKKSDRINQKGPEAVQMEKVD